MRGTTRAGRPCTGQQVSAPPVALDCVATSLPLLHPPCCDTVVGGSLRIAELCDAGAAVGARCTLLGETALHCAARAGRADAIAALLGRGADPYAQSRAPALLTPLEVAGFSSPQQPGGGAPGGECSAALRAAAAGALYAEAPSLRTAVFTHPDCLLHANRPGHQEAPERLRVILDRLRDPASFSPQELCFVPPEAIPHASDAQLLAVHSQQVRAAQGRGW